MTDPISRWDELTPYTPVAHTGTTNHRLVDASQTEGRLSFVHGRLEPGGAAERHAHGRSAQVTHILSGHCSIDLDGRADRLGPGDTVYIAPEVWHEFIVDGDRPVVLVNVYQPPLEADDILTHDA